MAVCVTVPNFGAAVAPSDFEPAVPVASLVDKVQPPNVQPGLSGPEVLENVSRNRPPAPPPPPAPRSSALPLAPPPDDPTTGQHRTSVRCGGPHRTRLLGRPHRGLCRRRR